MTTTEIQSPTEIQQFWDENGYYVARGVFSPEQVAALESEFDRMVAQIAGRGEDANARQAWSGSEMDRLDGGQSVVIHANNPQCFSGAWMGALVDTQFLDATQVLLGPDIVLHHAKLFQKPAEKGSPFPMHQDWPFFPTLNDSMMAGVIHVSNATDAMGCLRVYPGTHKMGRAQVNRGQLSEELREQYPIENALVVECEAGDVVFFHYLTLHGSMPNRSDAVRKTVLVQMHAGSDEVDPEGPAHPNMKLALRGWNHKMSREGAAKAG